MRRCSYTSSPKHIDPKYTIHYFALGARVIALIHQEGKARWFGAWCTAKTKAGTCWLECEVGGQKRARSCSGNPKDSLEACKLSVGQALIQTNYVIHVMCPYWPDAVTIMEQTNEESRVSSCFEATQIGKANLGSLRISGRWTGTEKDSKVQETWKYGLSMVSMGWSQRQKCIF